MLMMKSVIEFGALGDGLNDDYAAFQKAFDNLNEIYIPQGIYNISKTLTLHSDTTIIADKCAKIVMNSDKRRKRNEFLLSATDVKSIKISGGIWDGLNTNEFNAKPDLFDKEGYSGAVLNFVGVDGLTLTDMVISNTVTFYLRLGKVHNFLIENVDLISDSFGKNQDGLHFSGDVRDGKVKNIRALSFGQPNDDLLALNADDCVERVENLDLSRDAIENITFENIFAQNCHSIIRMLSISAPIRNLKFKNIYGGFRCNAINADAARYCKTPLFEEDEYPQGVGAISDIYFENFTCFPVLELPEGFGGSRVGRPPVTAIQLETHADNFVIENFKYVTKNNDCPALSIKNVTDMQINADGTEHYVNEKSTKLIIDNFKRLNITKKHC